MWKLYDWHGEEEESREGKEDSEWPNRLAPLQAKEGGDQLDEGIGDVGKFQVDPFAVDFMGIIVNPGVADAVVGKAMDKPNGGYKQEKCQMSGSGEEDQVLRFPR